MAAESIIAHVNYTCEFPKYVRLELF